MIRNANESLVPERNQEIQQPPPEASIALQLLTEQESDVIGRMKQFVSSDEAMERNQQSIELLNLLSDKDTVASGKTSRILPVYSTILKLIRNPQL